MIDALLDFMSDLDDIAWILSNLIIIYIAVALVIFVVGYYILFDPKATTAGGFVFRFAVSLLGVFALVFISLFVDPVKGREWFVFPGDVYEWRPLLRLLVYSYVAYTVTGLAVVLALRKWQPSKLKTAPQLDVVTPRKNPKGKEKTDGNNL